MIYLVNHGPDWLFTVVLVLALLACAMVLLMVGSTLGGR